jgi:hypothetical protein
VSRASSRLSSHMPLRHGTYPEDWSESDGDSSHGGDLLSESEDEEQPVFTLLKSSRPVRVGPGRDFYMLRVVRTSLSQPFGVNFDATESRDGRSTAVVAAEDYPHLSVKKRDRLMSVNGVQLRSAIDVAGVLQKAFSITMVFQRRGTPSHGRQPRVKDCWVPMAEVNRSLLSVTKASIVNRRRGEFKLALHRTSLKQQFGLPCEAVVSPSGSGEMSVVVSKDMPHLALKRNDRLCSMNGMQLRSRSEAVKVMHDSLSLALIFRRHPTRLRNLVHQIREIEEVDDEVEESDPQVCNHVCGYDLSGLWSMLVPDTAPRATAHQDWHHRSREQDDFRFSMQEQSQAQYHSSDSYRRWPQQEQRQHPSHAQNVGRRPVVAQHAEVYQSGAGIPARRHYATASQGHRSGLHARPQVRAHPRLPMKEDVSRELFSA